MSVKLKEDLKRFEYERMQILDHIANLNRQAQEECSGLGRRANRTAGHLALHSLVSLALRFLQKDRGHPAAFADAIYGSPLGLHRDGPIPRQVLFQGRRKASGRVQYIWCRRPRGARIKIRWERFQAVYFARKQRQSVLSRGIGSIAFGKRCSQIFAHDGQGPSKRRRIRQAASPWTVNYLPFRDMGILQKL